MNEHSRLSNYARGPDVLTAETVLFENQFLDISHDRGNDWLHVNWKGYQINESIKEGCNRLVELMDEYRVFRVLNDNTHTKGIWLGVAHWLVWNALPRARKAGLQSFAHVYGPSQMSRISADAALALLGTDTLNIRAFDDIESARSWLKRAS